MAPRLDSPPPSPDPFSRPRPRPPRSPGHTAKIRAQNRRRVYLEKHPDYFHSDEHELADPLLYDFLIRRFQTPSERQAEGQAKGYARVLEGSLLRGEERLAKLREQTVDAKSAAAAEEEEEDEEVEVPSRAAAAAGPFSTGTGTDITTPPSSSSGHGHDYGYGGDETQHVNETGPMATTFSSLSAELAAPPRTRNEGRAQWEAYLRDRFIRGEDGDFGGYALVDGDDGYDVLEWEEREEAWFEEEDPGWVGTWDGTSDGSTD
ncbi:hypothetical protein N658DRAFT_485044 [Parathielavia hyrcaniae]|uniref:CCD97-like C-terminal domain-containing protein n=1 Tax=Parathielavia hyrcaniae TaxID=113614 RepID=A0AAN6T3K0_9PEZI|nr:hypothetical protein N658DRAFT_485044 [Parathielavia hyrcaniae]